MKQKRIDKPWGHEVILEANDKYAMKILVVNAGKKLSLQYHEVKIETIYCVSGGGILEVTDHDTNETKRIAMGPGSHITIYPFDIHRLSAGWDQLVVLEASSPELEDVVRLEDDYGR